MANIVKAHRGWPFCFIGGVALQYPGRRPDAREFALRHRVVLCSTPAGVSVDIALGALPFEINAGLITLIVMLKLGGSGRTGSSRHRAHPRGGSDSGHAAHRC
jgi:hypothetical protein